MIPTTEFRNGLVIKLDNELYNMVEFQHVKPGKGGAFIRTKLKNLTTGRVIDRTFRSGEKVEDVRLTMKPVQYLYPGDHEYIFMDIETYDQVAVSKDIIGNACNLLKEGIEVELQIVDNNPINVILPIFVELKIVKTDPGLKGDTASGGTKPATLETGAVIQVPLFIEEEEIVKVDTRTVNYVERVRQS
jgi:elongation factor P